MPRFVPGHFRKLARLRQVGADQRAAGRRLYLAGDYLAGPWLDAALGSGLRAADELIADFNRAGPPA
jgi:predicted NAD/FAD-dependent oxidoreductase